MEVTTRCLTSLGHVSFSGETTVFLIDNALSFDRSLAACAPGLELEIHRPVRNLGFAGGCAWGISLAMKHGAELILLLNNDVTVDPAFLEHLAAVAARSPEAGLLSPRIVSMSDPARPWYLGGRFSLWSGIPVQVRQERRAEGADEPREVDYATGCAMLVKPAVVHSIGSFDPRFFAYCEDLDFSLRARAAGFKVLVVPRALVQHDVNGDTARVSLRIYYSTRNLLEVIRRHGAWYHWVTFMANFLVRWLGFFTLLACVRGRPQFVRALASGALDFMRGRLGERRAAAKR